MAEEAVDPETARARLLKLLKADEWQLSRRAEREGKCALYWLHERTPTTFEMVEYVVSLLKSDILLRSAPQGDPPGSTGIAWQMTDSENIFVKLRIEGGFGHESRAPYAYIQSIHARIHPKGAE